MKPSKRFHLLSERGSATVEFAISSVLFMFLTFAIVEYGSIFSQRMAVTQLAREGGSLASRQIMTPPNTLAMLASTDGSLDLRSDPSRYRIYLAQIDAATAPGNAPQCNVNEVGTLTHADVHSPAADPNCNLPANLWAFLQWNAVDNVPGVSQFTVLRVYYQHTSMTPVGGLSAVFGWSCSWEYRPCFSQPGYFLDKKMRAGFKEHASDWA